MGHRLRVRVAAGTSEACAYTLLQRLHGGGGLQRDQALPLQVENVLLLELLHLDELLLEGQLLAA